jgi:hypothetical protein
MQVFSQGSVSQVIHLLPEDTSFQVKGVWCRLNQEIITQDKSLEALLGAKLNV